MTGRRATDGLEPRQVRKEAAIRDAVCVVDRSRSTDGADFSGPLDGGCTTISRWRAQEALSSTTAFFLSLDSTYQIYK
ncbi:hypothetical protein DESC_480125 [Desulfosarcina cetonica]|nr:hypothetical protein DESC_480125 [Desulfosarcina cetonica]